MKNIVPSFELDGLKKLLEESGIQGVMKYTDVIVLNHLIERGVIPYQRDKMISTLKEDTDMDYSKIMDLVNKYDKWKKYLPSYSLQLNQKLDMINTKMDTVVPFRKINESMIGFVPDTKDRDKIKVMNGSRNHLIILGTVDKRDWSINWNENWIIQPEVNRYVIGEIKRLKKENWV
ncbi:hypothetical protein [Flagellimonas iocasae]|uniref:Uncharacterized protein n=1 Tax=Flagellimonas iocasae TaxID=2055905 RepID=A0ABW4XWV6_9FLAO